MIDNVETTIALQTGKKKLDNLLLKNKFKEAEDQANDMIMALIDLKWWLKKQYENN